MRNADSQTLTYQNREFPDRKQRTGNNLGGSRNQQMGKTSVTIENRGSKMFRNSVKPWAGSGVNSSNEDIASVVDETANSPAILSRQSPRNHHNTNVNNQNQTTIVSGDGNNTQIVTLPNSGPRSSIFTEEEKLENQQESKKKLIKQLNKNMQLVYNIKRYRQVMKSVKEHQSNLVQQSENSSSHRNTHSTAFKGQKQSVNVANLDFDSMTERQNSVPPAVEPNKQIEKIEKKISKEEKIAAFRQEKRKYYKNLPKKEPIFKTQQLFEKNKQLASGSNGLNLGIGLSQGANDTINMQRMLLKSKTKGFRGNTTTIAEDELLMDLSETARNFIPIFEAHTKMVQEKIKREALKQQQLKFQDKEFVAGYLENWRGKIQDDLDQIEQYFPLDINSNSQTNNAKLAKNGSRSHNNSTRLSQVMNSHQKSKSIINYQTSLKPHHNKPGDSSSIIFQTFGNFNSTTTQKNHLYDSPDGTGQRTNTKTASQNDQSGVTTNSPDKLGQGTPGETGGRVGGKNNYLAPMNIAAFQLDQQQFQHQQVQQANNLDPTNSNINTVDLLSPIKMNAKLNGQILSPKDQQTISPEQMMIANSTDQNQQNTNQNDQKPVQSTLHTEMNEISKSSLTPKGGNHSKIANLLPQMEQITLAAASGVNQAPRIRIIAGQQISTKNSKPKQVEKFPTTSLVDSNFGLEQTEKLRSENQNDEDKGSSSREESELQMKSSTPIQANFDNHMIQEQVDKSIKSIQISQMQDEKGSKMENANKLNSAESAKNTGQGLESNLKADMAQPNGSQDKKRASEIVRRDKSDVTSKPFSPKSTIKLIQTSQQQSSQQRDAINISDLSKKQIGYENWENQKAVKADSLKQAAIVGQNTQFESPWKQQDKNKSIVQVSFSNLGGISRTQQQNNRKSLTHTGQNDQQQRQASSGYHKNSFLSRTLQQQKFATVEYRQEHSNDNYIQVNSMYQKHHHESSQNQTQRDLGMLDTPQKKKQSPLLLTQPSASNSYYTRNSYDEKQIQNDLIQRICPQCEAEQIFGKTLDDIRIYKWKDHRYQSRDLFSLDRKEEHCDKHLTLMKQEEILRKKQAKLDYTNTKLDNFLHNMTGKMSKAGKLGATQYDENDMRWVQRAYHIARELRPRSKVQLLKTQAILNNYEEKAINRKESIIRPLVHRGNYKYKRGDFVPPIDRVKARQDFEKNERKNRLEQFNLQMDQIIKTGNC